MSQVQKTVAKTAAKGANKAANKTNTKASQQPGASFYIKDGFRPSAGAALFAYTMAWLQASGLIDGGSIDRGAAIKLGGSTMVNYHLTKTARLVESKGVITLAPGAANKFADRHYSATDRDAFIEVLTTGKPDGRLVKNPVAIGKLLA